MFADHDSQAGAQLRLLCVLAHPDDESLGVGGILARYAAEGVATSVITATRGEHGWQGDPARDPGPAALGQIREAELRAAAAVLGVREVQLLGYVDGELASLDESQAVGAVASHIRRIRPQVVVTFGPDGATGHPDHIAISQITTAAVAAAADAAFPADGAPHRAAKLYYLAESRQRVLAFATALGDTAMTVDGVRRRIVGWEPWAITTRVDARAHARQVVRAIRCHRSQLASMPELDLLSEEQHRILWGVQELYRASGKQGGGWFCEIDLFAGLRAAPVTAEALA